MKYGKAFPDQLKKIQSRVKHQPSHRYGGNSWEESFISTVSDLDQSPLMNIWLKVSFLVVCLIVFSGLTMRLFHLQIAEGKNNRDLADFNRILVKVIHAPRGVIYDRNGKILAQNEPAFRLLVASNSASTPHFTTITRDEALKLETSNNPQYYNLEIDSRRTYPYKEKMAHILGYVSEITQEEKDETGYKNYKPGDKVGRGGVEESFEKVLKGIDGGEVIEVDAQGKRVRTIRRKNPIPGQNLVLNIDADLQWVTYEKLAENVKKAQSCCGSVVIQNPQNGAVLALASYPSFDPNDISAALIAPNSPILNRAIAGLYPPGSTYKISSALAGLNSGKITPSTIYEDTGVMNIDKFTFANWYFTQYGRKEGPVDVVKAIQRSNDIYFYQLGQAVGEVELGKASKMLGLGEKLGIDIPGEEKGLIPDNEWKEENIGDVWYPGDTLHMAIGQGFVLTTPLQISNMISFIAAGGKQFPPSIGHQIKSPDGGVIKEFRFDPINKANFKQSDLEVIKKGLAEVPKAGGTAWPFFQFPIPTAGKTGTAEFGDLKKTHAWYTSYAPVEKPEIAITTMVEGGGEGSTVASPIAKEIYRWYFSPDKNNLIKDLSPVGTESATLGE